MAYNRAFHDKNARVIIGGTTLSQLNAWTLNVVTDVVNSEEFETDWVWASVGQGSYSGDLTGWLRSDKRVIMDAVTGQAAIELFIYPNTSDISNYFSGSVVFTSDGMSGSASGAAALTANFVGDGEPKPPTSDPWPATLWAGTADLGVYKGTGSIEPDAVQPTWATDNTGLPDMTTASNTLTRMVYDPADTLTQAVIFRDTSAGDDDFTVYYRADAGTWVSALTQAGATTMIGSGYEMRIWDIAFDQAGGGLLYALIANSNDSDVNAYVYSYDGSSWTLVSSDALPTGIALVNAYALRVNLPEIVYFARRNLARWIFYSPDSGYSYLNGGDDGTVTLQDVHYLWLFDYLVAQQVAGTADIYSVDKASIVLTAIQDDLNLGVENADALIWEAADHAHQRLLHDSTLYETTDAWASLVNSSPSAISPNVDRVWRLNGKFDLLVYANDSTTSDVQHTISVASSPTATPTGKSGASPGTSPYTGSIPHTAGGLVDGGLIF